MNEFENLITDLTSVRDRMAGIKRDHPWDENIRRSTIPRLDAALSDLRVVACRMREDQPRVTYDPATDQAVPVETATEPQTITESAMRAARVGWVVRTTRGHIGNVEFIGTCEVLVRFSSGLRTYYFKDPGTYVDSDYDIVSLAPPAVVEGVAEVGV
jgi:hypothetical protein